METLIRQVHSKYSLKTTRQRFRYNQSPELIQGTYREESLLSSKPKEFPN